MTRYVTRRPRPKLLWDDVLREEETGARSTVTVHEPEDEPQPTGLLDAQGNELMRETVRRPIGFVHAYEADE